VSKSFWFILPGVNPVPWTSPSVSVGHKGGKPYPMVYAATELKNYKQAIKEEMNQRYPDIDAIEDEVGLKLYFWRRLDEMKGNRRRKGHVADATNMQKATEDALQGILFKNDQQVVHAESWVMAQHDEVDPLIVIELTWHPSRPEMPEHVMAVVEAHPTLDLGNEHDVPVEDFI